MPNGLCYFWGYYIFLGKRRRESSGNEIVCRYVCRRGGWESNPSLPLLCKVMGRGVRLCPVSNIVISRVVASVYYKKLASLSRSWFLSSRLESATYSVTVYTHIYRLTESLSLTEHFSSGVQYSL